jgi:hypothetical protein
VDKRNISRGIEFFRSQGDFAGIGNECFRKFGAVDGEVAFVRNHRNRAFETQLAESENSAERTASPADQKGSAQNRKLR